MARGQLAMPLADYSAEASTLTAKSQLNQELTARLRLPASTTLRH
jgi:hypothetical protein